MDRDEKLHGQSTAPLQMQLMSGLGEPSKSRSCGVVVGFERFGPYHWARVRAAAQLLPITALELDPSDRTYEWDTVEPAKAIRQIVFIEGCTEGKGGNLVTRARSILDAEQPAALMVPGYADPHALSLLVAAREWGVPVVLMSASTATDRERTAWREAVKGRIVRMFDAALVGGRPQADYIVQLGMPRERVFLGYDAVDNEHFARPAPPPRVIERWDDRPFFLASARFVAKKNLPRLLESFARYRVLAGAGGWNLALLGDGELRPELEAKASALGLGEALLMPGFVQYPDLPGWYQAASCFVHASTSEQWGLVVNEAMAAGLPVLVSNRCGCAVDLVQEGVNGFTFDPLDVEQLARLMLRMAHEDVDRASMGAASRRIVANWGPERFARGLKESVECAIAQPRRQLSLADRAVLWAVMHRQ